MRICVLTKRFPLVSETFVYEPVRWLRAAGHEVRVVTHKAGSIPGGWPGQERARALPTRLRKLGALVRAAGSPVWSLRRVAEARRLHRQTRLPTLDILARSALPEVRRADGLLAHFGHVGAEWLPVAALARRPLAVYFHGNDASGLPRRVPGIYDALFASGAALLTNSDYLRERLIAAGAAPSRVAVVRLAAAPELAACAEPPDLTSRRVLTIARLVPKKGVEDSLAAFARAQAAMKGEWRYEIVGDGPLRDSLAGAAAAAGVSALVEFRGFLPRRETLESLGRASIFALASKVAPDGDTEGTPIALLEAATLGLPVVSTLHAGIPDLLPPAAGREGFLVREGDVEAFGRALERLAGDPVLRRDWGRACMEHARAGYSAAGHVKALVSALQQQARVPRLTAS
jgi:colanic acid/amylovoran biosynthesis glycosyltransferase